MFVRPPAPPQSADESNPPGTDTGEIEKLVSLINSNIHSSTTHEEKSNLDAFAKLFNNSTVIDLSTLFPLSFLVSPSFLSVIPFP